MTVFGDPLEVTISDPDRSDGEFRFLSLEGQRAVASWLWRTPSVRAALGSSMRAKRTPRKENSISQGVRGKHHEAYRAGTNVVFPDPDIAEIFTDSAAVNQALRQLVKLAKAQVSTKSRPDKALRPSSRPRRKAKVRKRSGAARG